MVRISAPTGPFQMSQAPVSVSRLRAFAAYTTAERRHQDVSEPDTSHSPVSTDDNSFGANQWLVDEMWQAYQKDPSSVDPAWHPYFEGHSGHGAPTSPPPAAAAAPPAAPAEPATPPPAPAEPTTSSQPSTGPINTPQAKTTSVQPRPQPIPAEAPAKQAKAQDAPVDPDTPVDDDVKALRGVAKTIAANMDQSIEVHGGERGWAA